MATRAGISAGLAGQGSGGAAAGDRLADPLRDPVGQSALRDPLRERPALDPAQAPIDAVLDGPPAEDPRDAHQKQRDLDGARAVAERLVARSRSTAEVEAFFPRLMRRFGLRSAHFLDRGEQGPALELQVNPKAVIDTKNLTLNNPTKSKGPLTQDVRFKTGTLGGDTVGVEMEAAALGPTHPQGGPPGGKALAGIMSQLPTNPKLDGDEKFIKGHLLNDNLGGPGTEENLFPITAQANKNHEAHMESFAKEWVNLKGRWVSYKVSVVEKGKDLSGDETSNYVDADLVCELHALDDQGRKTGTAKGRTIESRYKGKNDVSSQLLLGDLSAGKVLEEPSFDKDAVEWSTTKGDSSGPQEVDEEVRVGMRDLLDAAAQKGAGRDDVIGALARQFNVATDSLEMKLLMEPALDMASYGLDEGFSAHVGQWNRAVGVINANKTLAVQGIQSLVEQLKLYDPNAPVVGRRSSRVGISTAIRGMVNSKNKYKLLRTKAKVSNATKTAQKNKVGRSNAVNNARGITKQNTMKNKLGAQGGGVKKKIKKNPNGTSN